MPGSRSSVRRVLVALFLIVQLLGVDAAVAGNGPPSNTRLPTISDTTPTDGNTLTAYPGGWVGTNPVAFSYRWLRCDSTCSPISGATGNTFSVASNDVGHRLQAEVTATNSEGAATAVSGETSIIAARRPSNDSIPSVSGQPTFSATLTAAPGSWSGTPAISYVYRWKRCDSSGNRCNSIRGASAQTYDVQLVDAGSRIRVAVTASNDGGSKSAWSVATGVVGAVAPINLELPAISDLTPHKGDVLLAYDGSWSGTAPIDYRFQWIHCDSVAQDCLDIEGARSDSYVVTQEMGGRRLRVRVTALNPGGSTTLDSPATSNVVAPIRPGNRFRPQLVGLARVGLAYEAQTGNWSGSTPIDYTHQWLRCDSLGRNCNEIPGATSQRYTLSEADAGRRVRARVTATNEAGTASATTYSSGRVARLGIELFRQDFTGADTLITNQFAASNPTNPTSVVSPDWEVTSGSLFRRSGVGYSGVPDATAPDASSSSSTGSAVLRAHTKRSFANVAVSMRLRTIDLVSTPATPATNWDGVHMWLRYVDETKLYAINVNRRDNTLRIKKKCPGGSTNRGTYYSLSKAISLPVTFGAWQDVTAVVRTSAGRVVIDAMVDGELIARSIDDGVGCDPITEAAAVGVRGDNAEFEFDRFSVKRL